MPVSYTHLRIGMVCIPYYWMFEFIGPVIETIGYILIPVSFFLGVINFHFMVSFFALAILYGIILSIGALLLEENTFKKYPTVRQMVQLVYYAILDNFGYRQINTVIKVIAMFGYRKNKNKWGEIKRKSFQ